MATVLGDKLSQEKRLLLGQMSVTAAWIVLKDMMEEACLEATKAVMKVDPMADKYPELLQRAQMEARAMNDFSVSIIKSVERQVKVGQYIHDKQNPLEAIARDKNQADDLNAK